MSQPRQQWEYSLSFDLTHEDMAHIGREGWEAYAVVYRTDSREPETWVYFKRPLVTPKRVRKPR